MIHHTSLTITVIDIYKCHVHKKYEYDNNIIFKLFIIIHNNYN